jgi:hypothetical protein
MPRLSVHCVITHHDGRTQRSRRDTWIDAHDFRQLALAATAQVGLPPEQCRYKLFAPDVGKAFVGVLLEVVHEGVSVLVGPMGGPAVPASLTEDETCSLEGLIARVGLDADGEARGVLPVTVVYAGLLGHDASPPARQPRESVADYRRRRASIARVRLERGRHEGFHALRYDVPVAAWRAEHLKALLRHAYALLPSSEPRWRESGTITHEPIVSGVATAAAVRCTLEVQRGDFVAHVRLPEFPVSALADWLARRPCEINLCQPMARLGQKEVSELVGSRERETGYSAA